jgi:L-threonylcarbamoyladenylate synthase
MTDDRRPTTDDPIRQQYRRAIEVLRGGGVVALPTDTVYGLVAVASDAAAVERVYEIKARDPSQPMPLFVASVEQAALVGEMNAAALALAAKFWPGALTIVLRKRPAYATRAVAGGDTIAVRAPGDPFLREAAAQLGPLTGTSANIAGREECHTAAEVRAQLGDTVDLVVDAPVAATGRPSTIVDCSEPGAVRVVREGAISGEAVVEGVVRL